MSVKKGLLLTTMTVVALLLPVTGHAATKSAQLTSSSSASTSTATSTSRSSQTGQARRLDAPSTAEKQTATTAVKTPQSKLTLSGVKVTKTAVTGQTTADATVQVITSDHQILGTVTADAQGKFTVKSALAMTTSLTVRATKAGAQTATWQYTAKLKFTSLKVTKTKVSGHVAAGTKVKLINLKQQTVAKAVADANGDFTIPMSKKISGTSFTLKATKSKYHATSWQYRAPLTISKVKVTKHTVTGRTMAGTLVKIRNLKHQVLGRAVANKAGKFKVHTLKTVSTKPFDLKGTQSHYRSVTWKYTAPQKVTRLKVKGTKVTGHVTAGATVQLVVKQKVVGRAKANAKGNFKIKATRSLTTTAFTVKASKHRFRRATKKYVAKKLNVPLIAQRPELPTGCEITAVTMMLRYKGCAVTKSSLAMEMPRSSNPNKGFVGNPYTSYGWTIYPAGLMKLVKRHAHSAVNLTGVSITRLKKQINKKHPVTVWVTGVDGFNTHALTMTGYSPTRIYYNDPWTKRKTSLTIKSFKSHWKRDGYRALSY